MYTSGNHTGQHVKQFGNTPSTITSVVVSKMDDSFQEVSEDTLYKHIIMLCCRAEQQTGFPVITIITQSLYLETMANACSSILHATAHIILCKENQG